MYHCHVHFYYIGLQREVFETIKEMSPLEGFTHEFSVSAEPEEVLISKADVILAELQEPDIEGALRTLIRGKKEKAEIILLAGGQMGEFTENCLSEIKDIWPMPMAEAAVKFRFLRWQQAYKKDKDCWQTNHYLEAVMNGGPNLIWLKDKSGIHEKVNDTFCKFVNKSKEQVEGRGHAYIWDVEQEDPVCIEIENRTMQERKTHVFEEVVRTGEGERRLTTYKSPLYDIDGSVMGTAGIAVDVTQEHAYEKELKQKDQMLETMFTTTDCGVMCHTVDGKNIISINKAALRILGYESVEELIEGGFNTVAMSVVDEDKPKLRNCINALEKAGDSGSVEYRVCHKDGELLYVMGNVKLMEKNGELYYQRFLLDCTAQRKKDKEERHQMDLEVEYQEKLFDIFSTYLSSNTDDVYMMLGEGEKVEYVSPNLERVLGVSREAVEQDLREFGHADYIDGRKMSYEILKRMKPGDELEAMETERINQKTGEHRWFRENVYCVSIQNAKKIVVYISDRTKERKAQTALAETLEMAEVANKAKSTFLGSVSHDIRTPMNAIMGLTALLKEEADKPEHVREYTQKITAASQHLLGLINDVLDMQKIESGSTTLNISELNLAEVIEDLNTIIRPQMKAKGQTFEIFTSSLTYEHLLGDRLRINQILINILSNAVKYTQKGGRIELRVDELPQHNEKYSRIQFTISDNGQGMSEAYQKVIFNPFTREKATTINEIQGTGLGMAITKSLVDLMGGSIRVKSTLGEGSTFTVMLELRIQEKENNLEFWKHHGVIRMIVADDDELSCRNIHKAMLETGVDVDFATNGETAVEMIRHARKEGRPYDLMLLDWKMPGMDGLEVARLIRKKYVEKMPILLFTAFDWADIEEEALDVGISHFMPKPFFMWNFKNAIQRIKGSQLEAASDKKRNSIVKDKKILIVDDIEVNRMIMEKILEKLEAVCDAAENGKEAVEKFEQSGSGEYDIIFMDIQMPVMDGYEATRLIRASGHPSAKQVAIIAMTANAFTDDVQKALDSGMDAHVAKPVVLEQLKDTIKEVLESKKEISGTPKH